MNAPPPGEPVVEAPPPGGVGGPEWRRLSPRMLVIHPVQELLRSAPVLIGILVAGASSGNESPWSLAAVAVVVVLGTLRWFTTTYRVTPERVQVRRGLLRRRTLTVPRDRVRSVDVGANAMHRVLGLARVTVGTGRSDRKNEDALKLDALRAPEAARLRDELLHRSDTPSVSPGVPEAARETPEAGSDVELARWSPGWVRYGPFTLSGFVTVGVVAGFLSQIVSEAHLDLQRFGPLREVADRLVRTAPGLAAIEVSLALLVVVILASTLGYAFAFWGFRLSRHTAWKTLHVTRGLVSTRATTIEERRLRGVELSEPLLLRIARGARCIAIATGLRVGRGAERGGSLLLPPAPRREALRVAAEVRGGREPFTRPLAGHGPPARRRRYSRALAACALVVAALGALWWRAVVPAWVPAGASVLFPVGAILAADRYRNLGHAVVRGALVSSWGSLVRRRCVLSCDGIIGWNLRQTFFQRRAGLVTLTATTAAGRQRYPVQDVVLREALRTAEEAVPGLLAPFLVADREETPPRDEPRDHVDAAGSVDDRA